MSPFCESGYHGSRAFSRTWLGSSFAIRFTSPRGLKPLRIVYLDEAGLDRRAAATVVAGVIVDPDSHYVAIEEGYQRLIDSAPAAVRSSFERHATWIWSNRTHAAIWPQEDRLRFLQDAISLVLDVGAAICFGMCRRTHPVDKEGIFGDLTDDAFHHVVAFSICVAAADSYVRECGRINEIATLIAEDITTKGRRSALSSSFNYLRDYGLAIPARTNSPFGGGTVDFDAMLNVARIRDGVQFVAGEASTLLPIADHVAFGISRYLTIAVGGDNVISKIMSPNLHQMRVSEHLFGGGIIAGHPLSNASQLAGVTPRR